MLNRDFDVASLRASVTSQLDAYFAHRYGGVSEIGEPMQFAVEHLKRFVLGGGKRIRPLYGWVGFVGGGGLASAEDPEAVLRAVSALELIQACALIHDDIIDASDTRRGAATIHRAVESQHRLGDLNGDSAAYGRNTAILIGDLALAWADDMWRSSGVSAEALARAQEPWQGMRTEVLGGQLLDIYLEAVGSESAEMADRVNRYKTAAYTIERPLHLGAALAGAPEETIEAFRGYGRDIGIAFQLRDDILGVYGDTEITGKPAGDDLREGKRTVLVAEALVLLDAAGSADAATLREGIGHVTDAADVAALSAIIAESGAVDAVEARIDELTASGLAHVDSADITDQVREALHSLATKATARRA